MYIFVGLCYVFNIYSPSSYRQEWQQGSYLCQLLFTFLSIFCSNVRGRVKFWSFSLDLLMDAKRLLVVGSGRLVVQNGNRSNKKPYGKKRKPSADCGWLSLHYLIKL